jgi:hypothetical protein
MVLSWLCSQFRTSRLNSLLDWESSIQQTKITGRKVRSVRRLVHDFHPIVANVIFVKFAVFGRGFSCSRMVLFDGLPDLFFRIDWCTSLGKNVTVHCYIMWKEINIHYLASWRLCREYLAAFRELISRIIETCMYQGLFPKLCIKPTKNFCWFHFLFARNFMIQQGLTSSCTSSIAQKRGTWLPARQWVQCCQQLSTKEFYVYSALIFKVKKK